MQGTWKVIDNRDPKLENVVLVTCVNCALLAGRLGCDIHRIGGDKGE
jgi:hypothetical protein